MPEAQTEKATPRRRQKAREQGQVVRSRELSSALVLLAGTLLLGTAAPAFAKGWRGMLRASLAVAEAGDLSGDRRILLLGLVRSQSIAALGPVGWLMTAAFTVALLSGILQSGGLVFHQQAFALKFSRLSPATQWKQIVSLSALARMGKSLLPALVLVYLVVRLLERHLVGMPWLSLARMPEMFRATYVLLLEAGSVMLAWAAVDYAVEWRAHERRLRMSKQEIREEMKESDGSPMVKRRIRSIQRQMRRRRLEIDMSRASVVVTNPTHYAVALEFSFETMQAPKVLAKGMNLLAERIKQEARWAGVPIVPNPPLARSLYKSVEEGQPVPVDLYVVVAEILAYLYREELERRETERRARREQPRQHANAAAVAAEGARGSEDAGNRPSREQREDM